MKFIHKNEEIYIVRCNSHLYILVNPRKFIPLKIYTLTVMVQVELFVYRLLTNSRSVVEQSSGRDHLRKARDRIGEIGISTSAVIINRTNTNTGISYTPYNGCCIILHDLSPRDLSVLSEEMCDVLVSPIQLIFRISVVY